MTEKVLGKIRKLFALAESSNENESQIAMAKAMELMALHNLSMSEIDKKQIEYEKFEMESGQRVGVEDKFILPLIDKYFFVKVVYSGNREKGRKINFVGTPQNIEIAKYVYAQLERKFYYLWNRYRDQTDAPVKAKQGFYLGLYQGMVKKLDAQKVQIKNEHGLIIVNDPNLEKAVRSHFNNLKKHNSRFNADENAKNAGHEAANKININPGISDKNTRRMIGG
jgi:hypothetical protein